MWPSGWLLFMIGLATAMIGGASDVGAQPNPFRQVENWAQLPEGFQWGELADAHVDAQGNLWVLHRPPTPGGSASSAGKKGGGEIPILMFGSSLKLVKSFGRGMSLQPHGLHVDPEGNVWVTDSGPFLGRVTQRIGQNPQCRLAVQLAVARAKDLHPTRAEGGLDLIGAETGAGRQRHVSWPARGASAPRTN